MALVAILLTTCKKNGKDNGQQTVDDSKSSTTLIIGGINQEQQERLVLANIITEFKDGKKTVTFSARIMQYNTGLSIEMDNMLKKLTDLTTSGLKSTNYSFIPYFEQQLTGVTGFVAAKDLSQTQFDQFITQGQTTIAFVNPGHPSMLHDLIFSLLGTSAYADPEGDEVERKVVEGGMGMASGCMEEGPGCYRDIFEMARDTHDLWQYVIDHINKAMDNKDSYSADDLNKDLNKLPPDTSPQGNNQTTVPANHTGAWGEPHFTTTDGLFYDFQGYGEFIALKSTTDNFEIQVRQNPVSPYLDRQVTATTGIAINTGQDVLCFYLDKFYINKNEYSYYNNVWTLNQGSLTYADGALVLVTPNQDVIKFEVDQQIYFDYDVSLNSNRKGKVAGLLGNFDGTAGNDTQRKDGTVVNPSNFTDLYPGYANDWRVVNSLFVYPAGYTTANYTNLDYPKSPPQIDPVTKANAEAICRQNGVTTEPYLSACIVDVSLSGSDAYAISAQRAALSQYQISNFNIDSFSSFDQLDLNTQGDASIKNNDLYLTTNDGGEVGAVFKKYKIDITNGFEVDFSFQITDPGGITDFKNRTGGDGFAFVIQDYSTVNTPLSSGSGLGYSGLQRSMAIEFDTYDNGSLENQDDISLNTQGIAANTNDDSQSLIQAKTHPLPLLTDGKLHQVIIKYTKVSASTYNMEVYMDSNPTPYLAADGINLQNLIGSFSTGVFMGFTASTAAAYENHIIHSWTLKGN